LFCLKELKDEGQKFILSIVGDGPLRSELLNLTDSLDLNDCVNFLGHQQHVTNFYLDSNIFILPSISEGRSMSLIEAMSHGLVVVATPVGDASNLIQNGVSGFLASSPQVESLTSSLRAALTTPPDLLEKIGKNAQQTTSQQMNPNEYISKLIDLYDSTYKGTKYFNS
jgi:glycosyltransferase involved in cell wall biosynthesis